MERNMRAMNRQRVRRGGGDVALQDQALMREDLGFKMTGAGYEAYQADEASFQEAIGGAESTMAAQDAELSQYDKDLEGVEGELEAAYAKNKGATPEAVWEKYRGTWTPIHVFGDDPTKIEKTYYLPKEAADKLSEGLGTEGNYWGGKQDDGSLHMSIKIRGGKTMAKELHSSLQQGMDDIKDTFFHGEKFSEKRIRELTPEEIEQNKLIGMDNPFYEEIVTRGKSAASMVTEKQKAALLGLNEQRDILTGKRNELIESQALAKDQRTEVQGQVDFRQKQKDDLAAKHKTSVSGRQKLFALKGA